MAQYSSSPTSLSSPPSRSISDPGSPSRLNQGRANIAMGDEIIVDTEARFGLLTQPPPPPSVPLTAAGVPRKKPGRKPGAAAAAKKAAATAGADGTSTTPAAPGAPDAAPKQRRPRKPKDPNAPPIQRKRKVPPTETEGPADRDARNFSNASEPVRQTKITELASMRMDLDLAQRVQQNNQQPMFAPRPPPKREAIPGSMHNILNHDPSPPPQPQSPPSQVSPPPPRTSGQSYDPVRSSTYDPVRENMVARDPYGTGPLGSPRALAHMPNRASASPSIASLVDPAPPLALRSPPVPASQYGYSRYPEVTSAPTSPSNAVRNAPPPAPAVPAPKPAPLGNLGPANRPASTPQVSEPKEPKASKEAKEVKETKEPKPAKAAKEPKEGKGSKEPKEAKKPPPAPTVPASKATAATKTADGSKSAAPTVASFKSVATTAPAPAPSKKVASMVLQERKAQKGISASSSPRVSGSKELMPPVPDFPNDGNERSILDFGKANPGEQKQAPSIVLHIPLLTGENNKYINFMRMAEEKYGWDALHPREAAHRDRKARIAAASAALEKNSSRESGDEAASEDLSEIENSNMENGNRTADGAPVKKKAKRKDDYDKDDDFVDDSELLWEAQAAASKDGFFVYSGPLIPEVEKPAGSDGPPKRGRGGRGRGGTTRGGAAGRGSRGGGGPGSRGGTTTRKPRITKQEKAQLALEKAEREKMALATSKAAPAVNNNSSSNGYGFGDLAGINPPFSAGMVIDL